MTAYIILALVFSALQVADAVSTILVLRSGGYERNPIVAKLMAKLGVVPALAVKVVLLSAASIAAAVYYPVPALQYVLGALIAIYIYVVINNIRAIRR